MSGSRTRGGIEPLFPILAPGRVAQDPLGLIDQAYIHALTSLLLDIGLVARSSRLLVGMMKQDRFPPSSRYLLLGGISVEPEDAVVVGRRRQRGRLDLCLCGGSTGMIDRAGTYACKTGQSSFVIDRPR